MASTKPNYALWEINPSDYPSSDRDKQLRFIASYGHLAPSSHNTQPWKFVVKSNSIEIHADLKHRLPVADPTNKELYISVAATIPNIEIAGQYFGFNTNTILSPNSKDQNHIATITFEQTDTKTKKKALFPHITQRLTNRGKYQKNKPLPQVFLNDVEQFFNSFPVSIKIFPGENNLELLAQITKDGMYTALSNPAFRDELSTWVRHSWTDKGDGLPANTLGIPDAASIMIVPMVRSPLMAATASKEEYKLIINSSAIGVLFAPQNTLTYWIKTGMAYQALSLISTKHKLALSPLSASIEMPLQRQQLIEFAKTKLKPMMFFRIGFPKEKFPHAPRRPLPQVIA